jgi:hypothetical protein
MDADKPMSTPDMMEAHLAEARERLALEEKRAAAVKAFYGSLTPAQQKAFDEMHRHMGAMHGAMGEHGMMKGEGHEAHKPMDGPAH